MENPNAGDSRPESSVTDLAEHIEQATAEVIRGKNQVIRFLITALVARGHVLIEDVPGVGKTTLARALAQAVGGTFRRIQFTSDLLPSDILGVSILDQETQSFRFQRGPIFANIVLADEINRTSPRTQSSLLEALNEGQVTVDNETYPLTPPFMVIATQNPVEHYGTYPLPESQMDRFLLCLEVGYPEARQERDVVAGQGGRSALEKLEPVVEMSDILRMQGQVDGVRVDDELLDYAMRIVELTRQTPHLSLGVSTRGAIAWYRSAQSYALINGRDYCVPDDFKVLALPTLAHRLVLSGRQASLGSSRVEAEQLLREIIEGVEVPL
jgi:MoxR-like ATPase